MVNHEAGKEHVVANIVLRQAPMARRPTIAITPVSLSRRHAGDGGAASRWTIQIIALGSADRSNPRIGSQSARGRPMHFL